MATHKFVFVLLLAILASCNRGYDPKDAKDFLISKSKVGKVGLGMSFEEFRKTFKDFRIEEEPVWTYGVDGEGKGLRVSKDGENLLFVWGLQGSNKILSIVVLSEKFKTVDGLHVGISIDELIKRDPNFQVELNQLTDDEESFDKKNNLHLVFHSKDGETIGKYDKCIDCPSKVFNKEFKVDYLYIIEN